MVRTRTDNTDHNIRVHGPIKKSYNTTIKQPSGVYRPMHINVYRDGYRQRTLLNHLTRGEIKKTLVTNQFDAEGKNLRKRVDEGTIQEAAVGSNNTEVTELKVDPNTHRFAESGELQINNDQVLDKLKADRHENVSFDIPHPVPAGAPAPTPATVIDMDADDLGL